MRIQKAITESGFASRREAERLIIEGHVTLNDQTVYHPNTTVDLIIKRRHLPHFVVDGLTK